MTDLELRAALSADHIAYCLRGLAGAIKLPPDKTGHQNLAPEAVGNRLQIIMSVWKIRKDGPKQSRASSTRAIGWSRLITKIATAIDGLKKMRADSEMFEEFQSASDSLDNRYGIHPPNVEAKTHRLRKLKGQKKASTFQSWPIDRAVDQALSAFEWIHEVLEQAEREAEANKKSAGSKDPDAADHDAVRQLAALFYDATGRKATGPGRNKAVKMRKGWFLNFVENAFSPHDGRSTEAFASLIERALLLVPPRKARATLR